MASRGTLWKQRLYVPTLVPCHIILFFFVNFTCIFDDFNFLLFLIFSFLVNMSEFYTFSFIVCRFFIFGKYTYLHLQTAMCTFPPQTLHKSLHKLHTQIFLIDCFIGWHSIPRFVHRLLFIKYSVVYRIVEGA